MKRKISVIVLCAILIFCLSSCTTNVEEPTFSIQFIDVGQGDAALVECDGHYMLIDGGDTAAGDKVYSVLKEKDVRQLDILAVSHLHADHIGGLQKALTYVSQIKKTISNAEYVETKVFRDFNHELGIKRSKITVPTIGEKFKLGSKKHYATVEVVDVCADEGNDSLVLLITYGDTKFLFTGDIEETAQTRISEKYYNDSDEAFKINLMKIPHHGSYTGTLYRFLRTFMPDNVIISVGKDNTYGHPHQKTLDLLNSKTWKPNVYRTDTHGDIIVRSNGKEVLVDP